MPGPKTFFSNGTGISILHLSTDELFSHASCVFQHGISCLLVWLNCMITLIGLHHNMCHCIQINTRKMHKAIHTLLKRSRLIISYISDFKKSWRRHQVMYNLTAQTWLSLPKRRSFRWRLLMCLRKAGLFSSSFWNRVMKEYTVLYLGIFLTVFMFLVLKYCI